MPGEAIGAEAYAEVVAGILEFFDRPPVVVGHSFGGRVAVCLAAKHPQSVASLVLTGAPLIRLETGHRPPASYRLARWLNSTGVLSDDRMERLKKRRGSTDYRAASGTMRDILVKVVNESYEGQLGRIESPVHLLWGADDRDVPVSVAEAASAILADVTLEILPGVGHLVPTQAPARLATAIERAMG